MQGGPNWVGNYVDAPIIVNSRTGEYYKQPMYYALGHFSKFLTPGSVKIGPTTERSADLFQTTAFLRPDGGTVVIALNLGDDFVELTIKDSNEKLSHLVKPRSMQTYIYYRNSRRGPRSKRGRRVKG